jgi:hypothetical protein
MSDIFEINPSKDKNVSEYDYYTVLGKHEYLDSEKNPRVEEQKRSLAYTKQSGTDKQYYIKVGLYGRIYNPIGLYSEGRSNKFLSKVGKAEYNFTRVNQKVFNMYVNFLRTKNVAWLNNAERELA